MKKTFALILFASIFACVASEAKSQALSQSERESLLNKLEKGRKDLESATKGLSPTQLNFKPNVFRWSVAECIEHIALTEDFLFNITQQVLKTPAQTTKKESAAAAEADKALLKGVADRSNRFAAPEPAMPKQHGDPHELLNRFAASRSHTIEFVKTTQVDLRAHCVDAPFGKCTDAHQWLLLLSAHTERHLAQLLEVKADPKFPKQ